MMNYNDRWKGNGYVDAIPSDELDKAIEYVDGGCKSEKYLAVVLEAARRHRTTLARPILYNIEEGGERFAGRLKAIYCPTCKKKLKYGFTRCTKPGVQRCVRCGQTCEITQDMLDKR